MSKMDSKRRVSNKFVKKSKYTLNNYQKRIQKSKNKVCKSKNDVKVIKNAEVWRTLVGNFEENAGKVILLYSPLVT